MHGEPVGVAAAALDLSREPQEQISLADQVERDVGEAEVDLERGRMAAPFGQPLTQDHRVVAKSKQVLDERALVREHIGRVERAVMRRARGGRFDIGFVLGDRRHQICFTMSGMS